MLRSGKKRYPQKVHASIAISQRGSTPLIATLRIFSDQPNNAEPASAVFGQYLRARCWDVFSGYRNDRPDKSGVSATRVQFPVKPTLRKSSISQNVPSVWLEPGTVRSVATRRASYQLTAPKVFRGWKLRSLGCPCSEHKKIQPDGQDQMFLPSRMHCRRQNSGVQHLFIFSIKKFEIEVFLWHKVISRGVIFYKKFCWQRKFSDSCLWWKVSIVSISANKSVFVVES